MKTVFNWLLGIEHDVESLVAPLKNMVERLRDHAATKAIEASKHLDAASLSQALADGAQAEAAKAQQTAQKIGDLIS